MLYSPRSEERAHQTILVVYRGEPSTVSSVVPPFRRLSDPAVDGRVAGVCRGQEFCGALSNPERIARTASAVVVVAENPRGLWHGACSKSSPPT